MESLVSIYTPRVMIEAMKQSQRPTTFLGDLLVKRRTPELSDLIEIDVETGGKKVSVYTTRTANPTEVGKLGYHTNIHNTPYISEEVTYTSRDTRDRLPGENPYAGQNPRARLDTKIANWLADLQDRLIRREEQQIAEAIQTGKLVISAPGVNYTVDYQMNSSHIVVLTGSDLWSSTGDKIAQIEAWSALIRNSGAPAATDIIMGTSAAAAFLADSKVLDLYNKWNANFGSLVPQVIAGQGATFLMTLRRIGVDVNIYVYQAQYDDAGTIKSYIDPNKVVMLARSMRAEFHYGPIENLKHGTMVAANFPYIYEDETGKSGHVCLESAPLFGLHQPDAVVCATVL